MLVWRCWQCAEGKTCVQAALQDMHQQTAESASSLPEIMSKAVQAALIQARQAGLFNNTSTSGQSQNQSGLLNEDAQYQLRLLISEGLGEAVEHVVLAQAPLM